MSWDIITIKILIINYSTEDTQALDSIYYNTIHRINIQYYTKEQVDEWAPVSSLETEGWTKKIARTKPIVAVVENEIVGFAEFESNDHIYVPHNCRKEFMTDLKNIYKSSTEGIAYQNLEKLQKKCESKYALAVSIG